jgi:hypothetical protein
MGGPKTVGAGPISGVGLEAGTMSRMTSTRKAAGVSDIAEVVRRFETQEETANHLTELQVI